MNQIRAAAAAISARAKQRPRIGIVLGSGLSGLADRVAGAVSIPFAEIPHFVKSTVVGHPGDLVIGTLRERPVVVMRGRVHFYEGYPIQQVAFPIRVMWALGVECLILTNAAGGINPGFRPGDLMLIKDHIGLASMAGQSPLHGPNEEEIGPRFPDMTQVYDPELRKLALKTAQDLGIPLVQGVYFMSSGPAYETPAEIRFLHAIGADAVGMSTVPEATVARHAGLRVLGISGISNVASLEPGEGKVTHDEVLAAGQLLVAKMSPLIEEIIGQL